MPVVHLNSSFYNLLLFVVGIKCRNSMPKSMQQRRDDVTKVLHTRD